jgi:hypothetical protein
VTATYGQVTTGGWLATTFGAVVILTVVTMAAVRGLHHHRRSEVIVSAKASPGKRPSARPAPSADVPSERIRDLILEAMIVRERVAGEIDAATYQARMKDLACGGRS